MFGGLSHSFYGNKLHTNGNANGLIGSQPVDQGSEVTLPSIKAARRLGLVLEKRDRRLSKAIYRIEVVMQTVIASQQDLQRVM